MRYAIILILVIVAAMSARSQQQSASPEQVVRAFLAAYGAGDYEKAVACIENATYNTAFDAMAADAKRHPTTITISAIGSTLDGDIATVKVQANMKETRSPSAQPIASTLKLHLADGTWRIVAVKPDVDLAHPFAVDLLGASIWTLADPNTMMPTFWEARNRARTQVCTSNLKQLAIAAMMLAQDYDDTFSFRPDSMQKSLMPYLRDREAFHCPCDDAGVISYAINPSIAGVKQARIKSPSSTVLIYEGKAGKLNFNHDGKAGVAFADGKVKMVTEAEAGKLKWKP